MLHDYYARSAAIADHQHAVIQSQFVNLSVRHARRPNQTRPNSARFFSFDRDNGSAYRTGERILFAKRTQHSTVQWQAARDGLRLATFDVNIVEI